MVTANIAEVDITGSNAPGIGQGFRSDIYHEMGHFVHYRFNGNSLPSSPLTGQSHQVFSETDPELALIEGWPSYVANQTNQGTKVDSKYDSWDDSQRIWWRGDENETPPGTGLDGSAFESGEEVEGAVAGVWDQIHSNAGGFEANFGAMVVGRPNNILEFMQTFVNRSGGAGTAAVQQAFQALQDHGVVFTRAGFDNPPFDTAEPPDAAPPEDGNVKVLDGKTFVRGELEAKFRLFQPGDLGVRATIPASQVGVGFQPADTGNVTQNQPQIGNFTPFVPVSASGVAIDTRAFNTSRGDGEWDLLVFSENQFMVRDTLTPTWSGDPTPSVNTDEKYLKTVGAWFDGDRNPTTMDDGHVVVDNTAPTVKNFKP